MQDNQLSKIKITLFLKEYLNAINISIWGCSLTSSKQWQCWVYFACIGAKTKALNEDYIYIKEDKSALGGLKMPRNHNARINGAYLIMVTFLKFMDHNSQSNRNGEWIMDRVELAEYQMSSSWTAAAVSSPV